MRFNRRMIATSALALATLTFLSLNIAANVFLGAWRLDLTARGLYTLSEGTYHVLETIGDPIRLRFFYSEKLAANYPQIRGYGQRVRDMLDEYEANAGGKLAVEFIDPEPFSEEEDRAVAEGLTGAPTDSGETVYFGLVGTNTVDGREAISFFAPEREQYLEYDLTAMVDRLNAPARPKLGILTSLPLDMGPGGIMAAMQGRAQPFIIYEQLRQAYDVELLPPETKEFPKEMAGLLVVHPVSLSQATLYAIDQFVLGGGHAAVFVDPWSEIGQASSQSGDPMMAQMAASSDLAPLFKAWGVGYDPGLVVLDRARAQRVQYGQGANRVFNYPLWIGMTKADFAQDEIATGNINTLSLGSAGSFHRLEGASTSFTPLVWTSEEAMEMSADEARMMPDPMALTARYLPSGQSFVIAARISGNVKSAFPDGPPKPEEPAAPAEGEEKPAEPSAPLAESRGPVNVIVVADTDLFDDRFWVQVQDYLGQRVALPSADNGAFVLNIADLMLGSTDLVSLRTRERGERPFTLVEDIRREAEARFLAEQQQLEGQIAETQRRIDDLQRRAAPDAKSTAGAVMTPEQEAEIARFRQVLLDSRQKLRAVQRGLRQDIDALGNALAFVNIALMPILVGTGAVTWATVRARKRKPRPGAPS